ncbi:MAG: hypothetical protein GTO00_05990 [Deltaproteobacteria bacterium]|nr:hypothetical protein [Deltaproteobacteria bacterium]
MRRITGIIPIPFPLRKILAWYSADYKREGPIEKAKITVKAGGCMAGARGRWYDEKIDLLSGKTS